MIWYDIIWYDIIWYYMILYDIIWDKRIWYDIIWYDMTWYDMIWYDMLWCDMIWYETMRCDVTYPIHIAMFTLENVESSEYRRIAVSRLHFLGNCMRIISLLVRSFLLFLYTPTFSLFLRMMINLLSYRATSFHV